ncbi:MAG: sigma-70 family RNA polymerase sigma factor [Acidobacteria bacterium]|nr:sigma-70 family RNA polymerase sigma factor [Acidobacteriota bacterium]
MKRPKTEARAEDERIGELQEWLQRSKQQDLEAFHQLYQRYSKRILNYIYRMTGSVADAEDLTQETFVSAFQNLKKLKDDGKFESWLFTIARNNVYQQFRKKQIPVGSLDAGGEEERSEYERIAAPVRDPQEEALYSELQHVVNEVIEELPEKYREVFVLSAIQHYDYKRISEIVGRSLASVKTDIHRARLRVRDRVKRYLGQSS